MDKKLLLDIPPSLNEIMKKSSQKDGALKRDYNEHVI